MNLNCNYSHTKESTMYTTVLLLSRQPSHLQPSFMFLSSCTDIHFHYLCIHMHIYTLYIIYTNFQD